MRQVNADQVTEPFPRNPVRLPRFGVGLRRPHFDDIFTHNEGVDFLEIITENFMNFGGRPRRVLHEARDRFPVVLHGVSLSVGGLDPFNTRYLDKLTELIEAVRPPWFSDHLSWSSHGGVEHHDLIPLPFTEQAMRHVVIRIQQLQRRVRVPFALENPSYYVVMPGAEMSEAEFVREVITRADCALLLDINNVHVNATNHGYDARQFVDQMPADRVLQYHMAGHDDSGPLLIDNHGAPVVDPVLDLYQYALRRIGPAWTLLEWDNDIPTLDVLLAENRRIRRAARQALDRTNLPAPSSRQAGPHGLAAVAATIT